MNNPSFSLRRQFIATPQAHRVFQRMNEVHEDMLRSGTSKGLMLLGLSGSGKTTTVRQYLASAFPGGLIPGGIRRTLRVEIPSSPTKKNLATAVLTALDDPFANARSHSAEAKFVRIVTLLRNLKTEILILDEAQHLVDCHHASAYDAADWIKSLMNECCIVVVLVGLKRAEKLLWANEQLRRRFSAGVTLERYTLDSNEQTFLFASLLKSIQTILPVPTIEFIGGDTLRRFHFASHGLIDYIIKVMDRSVWQVQMGRAHGVDLGLLSAAFRDEVWSSVPAARNPFSGEFNFKPLIGTREPFENFESTDI